MFDFLILLVANKRTILLATLLAGIAGVVVSLALPARYTAVTTLLAPPQATPFSSAFLSQVGTLNPAIGGLGLKNPADLYVSLLKSRSVEDAMIQRFHLVERYRSKRMSEARRSFERNCEISTTTKDGLIRLSIQDRDPKLAAEMANGYVEEYRRFSADLAVTEAAQRRLFLGQQLQQAKEGLATAEENFKQSEQNSGMIQLDGQTKALIESAAAVRAQIAAKEVQLSALSSYETDANPEVSLAKQQLTALQSQLKQLGGSEAGSGRELIALKGQLPEAGLVYIRKLREVKYQETIFDLLAKQYESAKLDEARHGAVIQVVDSAVVPDLRSSPLRSFIVLGALIAGAVLGVFIVWLRHSWSKFRSQPAGRSRLDAVAKAWSGPSVHL
jgi:uncharacterized protein involved in exopolysaccharide biosynthesis